MELTVERVRGVAFLLSGLVAAGFMGYLVLFPETFRSLHPVPILILLFVTMVVALQQAYELLR